MTTSHDESERKVGRLGNSYEDNPGATRHPRAEVRVRRMRKAATEPDAALEKASLAQKALDPGGEAAPDHGAPVGASNAMKFHTWGKAGDSDGGDPQ